MKVSFYFVLWILIYPILGLFNNSFIDQNAFIVALVIVWGLSWLLNFSMPRILSYENALQVAPILEDVYTGNVSSFRKRLVRETNLETVTALYLVSTVVVMVLVFSESNVNDWIALAVFGALAFNAIRRSVAFYRAKAEFRSNPTPEQCMHIAQDTFDLDYQSYYEQRERFSYEELLSPKPKYFSVFRVFSIVIAVIAALLGLYYIALSILIMLAHTSLDAGAVAGMVFLYGSLATYFGVKDFFSSISTRAKKKLAAN